MKKVEKGFFNREEINTVYYDPNLITIKELVKALQEAETYLRTLVKQ